jgi:hypothetical protein
VSRSSQFFRCDESLLGDEDTIKELTFIFVSNVNSLADTGAAERKVTVVSSLEDHAVLDLSAEFDGDSLDHVDVMDLLSTDEVLDVDARAILGDDAVDGEMSVNASHFVLEALGDTDAHVVDVGFKGVDGTSLFVATEPHADSEVLATGSSLGSSLGFLDLTVEVREVLFVFTSRSLDGDNSGLDGASDAFGDNDPVFCQ